MSILARVESRLGACMHVQLLSCIELFATPCTVAHQAPLSTEFPRQEYWSGLSFPPPGDLPDSGIEPVPLESPTLQVNSLPLGHLGSPPDLGQYESYLFGGVFF